MQDTRLASLPSGHPRESVWRPLGAFFVDLSLAVSLTLLLMFACGAVWVLFEGVRAGLAGSGGDAQEAIKAIGRPGILAQLWFTVLGTGGAALALYFWRRRASPEERRLSRAAASRHITWWMAAAAGTATFLFTVAATQLGERFGVSPDPSNLALIKQALASHPLFLSVFVVVLAPAYEELLFRRVLFGRLWAAGRPLLGMLLSSLAFALAHELPGVGGKGALATVFLLLVYMLMGMLFAWLYRRTGTLWAPMAAHAVNNALALAALRIWGTGG
ncbi:MAG TPA: CPBP family intramembrane glutamic endopeptidase [Pseudoxanthomonas sp.]|nr:CPBP family intramembrane glutamic endopeptidase [Pseudoxanthomonas sp.]